MDHDQPGIYRPHHVEAAGSEVHVPAGHHLLGYDDAARSVPRTNPVYGYRMLCSRTRVAVIYLNEKE